MLCSSFKAEVYYQCMKLQSILLSYTSIGTMPYHLFYHCLEILYDIYDILQTNMHISLTLKQGFWSRTEYCDYRNRHQVKKFELYGFFEHRWKTHASNRNIIFEYCKNYFLIRWMFRFNLCTSYLFLCCHVKIPTQRENAYDRLGHRIIIITLVVNPYLLWPFTSYMSLIMFQPL